MVVAGHGEIDERSLEASALLPKRTITGVPQENQLSDIKRCTRAKRTQQFVIRQYPELGILCFSHNYTLG
ncbi:hypothetical protein AAKU67_002835 [Oxalobacteraceae bacterium GrIS 2.11]